MLLGKSSDAKIAAIGDSITRGFPEEHSWVDMLSRKLSREIVNYGLNGDTLQGIMMRYEHDIISNEFDIAIITGGTNDVYLGYDVKDMKENIMKMIELSEINGVIPIIGTPIPITDDYYNKKLDELRHWIKTVCPVSIPFHTAFYRNEELQYGLYLDEIHPSEMGHNLMAEMAMNVIQKTLNEFNSNSF